MMSYLTVSVVIPVHNSAAHLKRCLAALSLSTYERYECLVVDDGSTDASHQVAAQYGARVIALSSNRGPAYARNRGAEAAAGDVLLFVDADVCVHPGTVAAVAAAFARYPDVAALMGSYDDQPADPSFLSQYKNLFHHYVHQRGEEEASTFWSGCGAVRRALFLAAGGFNEGYTTACIEDIELGFRLRRAGHSIRLEKGIQATHWKRWGFRELVKTDLFRRGVPWVALMWRDRRLVGDLNLRWPWRVCTVLTYLLVATLALLAGSGSECVLLPALAWVGFAADTAWLYDGTRPVTGRGSAAFGLAAIGGGLGAAGSAGSAGLLPLVLLLAILGIQHDFYRFWIRKRGLGFAMAVVPFHLLYFLYSSLAVPLGIAASMGDERAARERAVGPAVLPLKPLIPAQGTAREGARRIDIGWKRSAMMDGSVRVSNCSIRLEGR